MAQLVKNLPAMWETWVRSLDWDDPLEKGRLPTPVFWPREFHGLYSPWGRRVRHDWATFSVWLTDGEHHLWVDFASIIFSGCWSRKLLSTFLKSGKHWSNSQSKITMSEIKIWSKVYGDKHIAFEIIHIVYFEILKVTLQLETIFYFSVNFNGKK